MSKPTVVGFAYSIEEVEALRLLSLRHPHTHVDIITPTLAGQLYLRRHGMNHRLYQKLEYSTGDYNSRVLTKEYDESKNIITYFNKNLSFVRVAGIPFTSIIQIILEQEIVDVIHAYYYYKKIEKSLQPSAYLIPQGLSTKLSGWHAQYYSHAALMADFFIPKYKLKYFNTQKNTLRHFREHIGHLMQRLQTLGGIGEMVEINELHSIHM